MLKLACSKFLRSTNKTTYLTHNKGVKICGIFSETIALQSQSPFTIAWVLCIFSPSLISTCKLCARRGLHFSAFHVVIVEEFLKNCMSTTQDEYTPLVTAAWCGKCDVISELLDNGADVNAQNYVSPIIAYTT